MALAIQYKVCLLWFSGIFLGTAGAWAIGRFAYKLNLLDRPNERSSHSRTTPKGGGIGILAALCVTAGWLGFPVLVWMPAAFLSLASLLGDRIEMSSRIRLVIQFAAAGMACHGLLLRSGAISGGGWPEISLGLFFTLLYIATTANVYNFMDGINGIAALTGIVSFGFLALTGWVRGEDPRWVFVAVSLAAACAGFLPWNFPRARVFMGDAGSVLLGFMFAVFVVAWSRSPADFLMFSVFLFPFYADEAITLPPRLRSRDSLTSPHRRHVYQILVNQMGVSHWKIALLYAGIQAGAAGVAVSIRPWGWIAEAAWICLSLGVMGAWAGRVRRHEV
jgi:Fuc2NAc and GlcNAc transferase